MKLTLLFTTLFLMSPPSFANEAKDQSQDAVKAINGTEKKSGRKKKAQMCGECGKPESECECHGHKEPGHKHAGEKH